MTLYGWTQRPNGNLVCKVDGCLVTLDGGTGGWNWLVSGRFLAGGGAEPTAQRAAERALAAIARYDAECSLRTAAVEGSHR